MSRDEVIEILKEKRAELEAMKVTSMALFGSVARGEEGPESDVDLLIDVGPTTTLFDLARIELFLEPHFKTSVDVLTRGGVHPALEKRIFDEAINIWP